MLIGHRFRTSNTAGCRALACAIAALLGFALFASGTAEARDRTLGYGDVGLYGPISITESTAALSFDFVIVVCYPHQTESDAFRRFLERAATAGVSVILDLRIFQKGESTQRAGAELLKRTHIAFREALRDLDRSALYAVTLGEENVPSGGVAKLLSTLYARLKKEFPDTAFYQWYTPSAQQVRIPGESWPNLPADGWVVDNYPMKGAPYEKQMAGYARLGKPVVSILWLTPDRAVGRGRDTPATWWNDDGWRDFHHQLAVAARHDIPVAFFMMARRAEPFGKQQLYPDAADEQSRAFFREAMSGIVPFIRSRQPIPIALPAARPEWIPAWPPDGS